MPQTPKTGTSNAERKRYCGLGNHHLRLPHRTIMDDKLLNFAKYINHEIRKTTLLCGTCYDTLVKIFKVKMSHARVLHKEKKRAAANANSISDVSNSQAQHSSSSNSSTVSAFNTTSSTSNQATTSTVKRKREEQQPNPGPQHPTSSSETGDDDESLLSLNAVNGTRLPNIQPIPKRREFVHLNKHAMDIYLAGTTGG